MTEHEKQAQIELDELASMIKRLRNEMNEMIEARAVSSNEVAWMKEDIARAEDDLAVLQTLLYD